MTKAKHKSCFMFHTSDGNGGFTITKEQLQSFYTMLLIIGVLVGLVSWAVSARVVSAGNDEKLDAKIDSVEKLTNEKINSLQSDVSEVKSDVKDIKAYLMDK
jgi:hypothetical protein